MTAAEVQEEEQITIEAATDLWAEFIGFYKSKEVNEYAGGIAMPKYKNQVYMMPNNNTTRFILDYNDLIKAIDMSGDPLRFHKLNKLVVTHADEAIESLKIAVANELEMVHPDYHREIYDSLRIEFVNTPFKKEISQITHDFVNCFVTFKGLVVKMDDIQSRIKVIAGYRCVNCDRVVKQPMRDHPPYSCPACNQAKTMKDSDADSKFDTFLSIKVQQREDKVEEGRTPPALEVHLYGPELIHHFHGGHYVIIDGILRATETDKESGLSEFYVEASHMTVLPESQYSERIPALMPFVQSAVRAYSTFEDQDYQKLIDSIAPDIYGHGIIKENLLLMLVGSKPMRKDGGGRHRGDINTLVVSDPGLAKTEMAKYMERAMPRAYYNSGRKTSTVGMLAGVTFEDGRARIEMGAYGMAGSGTQGGLVIVDELEKKKREELEDLAQVMEDQQQMTVRKATLNREMRARCASLHLANPKKGKYDRTKTITENTGFEPWQLSRYDTIWVISDEANKERDTAIFDHSMNVFDNAISEEYYEQEGHNANTAESYNMNAKVHTLAFMKQWGIFVRNTYMRAQKINIPVQIKEKLKRAFLELREMDARILFTKIKEQLQNEGASEEDKEKFESMVNEKHIPAVTMREISTLVRLTIASAIAHMRNEILEKDADIAINLVRASLISSGYNPATNQALSTEGDIDASVKKNLTEEKRLRDMFYDMNKIIATGRRHKDKTIESERDRRLRAFEAQERRNFELAEKVLEYVSSERCDFCNGRGQDLNNPNEEYMRCDECRGLGRLIKRQFSKSSVMTEMQGKGLARDQIERYWRAFEKDGRVEPADSFGYFRLGRGEIDFYHKRAELEVKSETILKNRDVKLLNQLNKVVSNPSPEPQQQEQEQPEVEEQEQEQESEESDTIQVDEDSPEGNENNIE